MIYDSDSNRATRFRRLKCGVAIEALAGVAVLAFAPQAAMAQGGIAPQASSTSDANDGDIVITGIRAAIVKGLESKRNADSIIDSISAEDIGKFPDANIAEAVQRIPGVSIDRQGGEGRHISINGLGPDFSLTLFNGRQIASSDVDRSFSFDTIASNLVSKVNVYKTANAIVPEGGMGGTIDIITARPFDYDGFMATVQAAYQYDTNSKDAFPEASFVIANQFMDGRLGLLLSFTHQKRHGLAYQSTTSGFLRNSFVDGSTGAYVDDTNDEAWRAWEIQYGTTDTYRTRDGGTAVLQFKPSDDLVLTADYLYSKFNVKEVINTGGAYLWGVQDTAKTIRESNGVYSQLDIGGQYPDLGSYSFNNFINYRPTTTQQGGLNLKWTPSEKFSAVLDGFWSKATTNNRGRNQQQTLEMLYQPEYLAIFPTDGSVPYFDLLGRDLTQHEQDLRARLVGNTGTYVRAQNKGLSAAFEYKFDPAFSLSFGANYNIQEKSNVFYRTPQAIMRMYHGNAKFEKIDTSTIVDRTIMAGSRFGNPGDPFPVFVIDPVALRTWMADPVNIANRSANATAGGLQEFIANGRTWNAVMTTNSFRVRERDFSAYADLHIDTEVASMPLNIVGGLRYSRTALNSYGSMEQLTNLTLEVDDDGKTSGLLFPSYLPESVSLDLKNHYAKWLPSFNVKLEPVHGLILRASASRTMSRPTLDNLAPMTTYGGLNLQRRNASGGNPYLRPFVSTNLDASAEWYYSRSGALSVSLFHKRAKDFIVNLPADEIVPTVQPEYQTFRIVRPRNAPSATIDGFTAAWTHTLDMGLGMQLNYTKVSSSTKVAPGLPAFAVPGVSDTANAVLFFEKYGFSARAAFNWRSRFLVTPGVAMSSEPTYGDAYHQIDARIGYDFGNNLTIGLEGTNITNSKVKYHNRYQSEFVGQYDYGRQLRVSVAKKF